MATKEREVLWKPNPGPQTQFLASSVYEILYGGAAGGGKSEAITIAPLRWVQHQEFYSITFRRETPQLVDLLKKAERYYPPLGGRHKSNPFEQYRFPSGALVRFGHIDLEKTKTKYQGQEINLLQFDELTHFSESQYLELVSRVRSANPKLPRLVRSTTNPGGEGHDWVFRRWGPWLDPDFFSEELGQRKDIFGTKLPPAKPGETLWVVNPSAGVEVFHRTRVPKSRSRTFIPARIEDNPKLAEADPDYEQRLLDNDPVRAAQLRDGNWLIRPAKGLYFKRAWFGDFVDAAPAEVVTRIRFWDMAGTKPKPGRDPDWTVGLRYAMTKEGLFFIEDVVRFRGDPGDVHKTVRATAEADGTRTIIGLEQDPGQAGKDQIASYMRELSRFTVRVFSPTGDKILRAGPVSSQCKAGNLRIVRDPASVPRWLAPFLQVLEEFPEGSHDDDVDALSGAHNAVTNRKKPPTGGPGSIFDAWG